MDDASDEIIQRRIRAYEESTRELIDHYADRRAAINAAQAPVKVTRDILSVIVAHPEWLHHTGEE